LPSTPAHQSRIRARARDANADADAKHRVRAPTTRCARAKIDIAPDHARIRTVFERTRLTAPTTRRARVSRRVTTGDARVDAIVAQRDAMNIVCVVYITRARLGWRDGGRRVNE